MEINKEQFLKVLNKQYPNIEKVSEEIINLQAILNLPKGTELFLSDIHGEYGSFSHILNNGSGIIRSKIESIFKNQITEHERRALATLIYSVFDVTLLLFNTDIYFLHWNYSFILLKHMHDAFACAIITIRKLVVSRIKMRGSIRHKSRGQRHY